MCVTVSDLKRTLSHHWPKRRLYHRDCSNKFQKSHPTRDTSEPARPRASTKCESTDQNCPRQLIYHLVRMIHYRLVRRVLSANGDRYHVQLPITFFEGFSQRNGNCEKKNSRKFLGNSKRKF